MLGEENQRQTAKALTSNSTPRSISQLECRSDPCTDYATVDRGIGNSNAFLSMTHRHAFDIVEDAASSKESRRACRGTVLFEQEDGTRGPGASRGSKGPH